MAVQTGTFDPVGIKGCGATQLSNGVHVRDWRVESTKRPIVGEADVAAYQTSLGNVLTVPEILFGRSELSLTHVPSGTAIVFRALDALRCWRHEALPPLKVQLAAAWQAARREEIAREQALVIEYDWTYTSNYACTLERSGAVSLTSATGTVPPDDPEPALDLGWEDTTDQIDRSLLMQREPILFYDEVRLYESELDDNGACQLIAKVRVMPRCWFVLLRFWLRVDGSMVRLRDTRLFCRFDQSSQPPTVLREVKYCEGSFAELRAAGAPGQGPAYDDPDSAAEVFSAIAPCCVKLYKLQKLVL